MPGPCSKVKNPLPNTRRRRGESNNVCTNVSFHLLLSTCPLVHVLKYEMGTRFEKLERYPHWRGCWPQFHRTDSKNAFKFCLNFLMHQIFFACKWLCFCSNFDSTYPGFTVKTNDLFSNVLSESFTEAVLGKMTQQFLFRPVIPVFSIWVFLHWKWIRSI